MGNRMSPLRRAIALDDVKKLEEILQEAGDGSADLINEDYTSDCFFCCFRNVQSPMHTAMSFQREMVVVMVKYGGDVNCQQKEGLTMLHRAARQDHVQLAKLFLEYGADLTIEDDDGCLPLHSAALSPMGKLKGSADVLHFLIEESLAGDLEVVDSEGNTPLHLAAHHDFPAAVRRLLRAGAKVDCKNHEGKTPRDLAGKATRTILAEDGGKS